MAARTTREEARARILAAFAAQLDRVIPPDAGVALKGATFADFEDQVETLARAVLPVALEQRSALSDSAQVTRAGRCPHCGSDGVYLERERTQPEVLSRHGRVVVPKQHARCRACGGSFSPQVRDWALPGEVALTPRAARRVAREGVLHSFDQAASALNEDWGTSLDGKQVQRWAEAIGRTVTAARESEVRALEQGHRPAPPLRSPELLVIGMDGGRVQTREKQGENGSRWREDKVGALTSYQPGDGTTEHPPQPLVTTYTATMGATEAFGKLLRVEAERRGLRQACTVLVIGDGGNWIDPLSQRECLHDQRIVDYYHAAEHLHDAARAALGRESPQADTLAEQLKQALWDGQMDALIATLEQHAKRLGPPRDGDGPEHPRRVLANNVGYFQTHRPHMDYPTYRRQGWPIGSGVTEAGVKQFNKRVKGTEQFWSVPGVETILSLRALWLSQDDRWQQYWNNRPAYTKAA